MRANVFTPEDQMAYDWQRGTDKNAMSDPLAMMRGTPSSRPMSTRSIDKGGDGREKSGALPSSRPTFAVPYGSQPLTLKGGPGVLSGSGGQNTLRGSDTDNKRVIDTIIAEALGEGDKGMTAVAYTILNRSVNRGLTPLQVVKQQSQYSGYDNPGSSVKRAMSDPDVRARVEHIWNNVETGSVADPTQGGEYFHTTNISPSWSKGVNRYGKTTLGNHVFYLGQGPVQTAQVDVPPRRPSSDTGTAAILQQMGMGGSNPGVPGQSSYPMGYAPPSPSTPAPNMVRPSVPGQMPEAPRLTAQGLNDWVQSGRFTPAPRNESSTTPRLTEQSLTNWIRGGNYTPAPRNNGLTTRHVTTVPVNSEGGISSGANSLQEALQRYAEERRRGLTGADPVVDPNAGLIRRRLHNEVAGNALSGMPPVTMAVRETPWRPRVAGRPEYPGSLPASSVPDRLTAQPDLAPANLPPGFNSTFPFGMPPGRSPLPMPSPLTPGPIPARGGIGEGANAAGLGGLIPNMGGWGSRPGVPPEQMTNPTTQEVVNGIANGTMPLSPNNIVPPFQTGGMVQALTSPQAQTAGLMNAGRRPLLSAFMRWRDGLSKQKGNPIPGMPLLGAYMQNRHPLLSMGINALMNQPGGALGRGANAPYGNRPNAATERLLRQQRDWLGLSSRDRLSSSSPLSTYRGSNTGNDNETNPNGLVGRFDPIKRQWVYR